MTIGAPGPIGPGPRRQHGDALIFAGSTRLVNTNDLTLTSNAWLRFDSGNFTLWGNALALGPGSQTLRALIESALDLTWSSTARTFHVAAGSELIIAGNELVNTGDHTNTGGGRIRLTGTHTQPLNPPATILNNIEYVIDGGSFSNAGGVRITSGTTPSASTLILTNGASMIQGVAAGAVRVGDAAGIQGPVDRGSQHADPCRRQYLHSVRCEWYRCPHSKWRHQ